MKRKGCRKCEYTGFAYGDIPCECTEIRATGNPCAEIPPPGISRTKAVPAQESFWTKERIAEALDTWANFSGFSGETCGTCKLKSNVMARSPGWFCSCGAFNCQSWSRQRIPYRNPDIGPNSKTIRDGYRLSKTYNDAIRRRHP